LRQADGSYVDAPQQDTTPKARGGLRPLLISGGLASLLLAGVVSFFASGHPDGLEYVAESEGFIDTAREHALGGFALADYGEVGGIPVGLAGVLGVLVTVAAGLVL